jgi:uncharacterized membrane protein YphA (DoxX/SURF4 family)
MTSLFIGSLCLVTIYLLSAVGKIQNLSGTAKYLQNRLTFLPIEICLFAIIMVIILQLLAPSFILFSAITNKAKSYAFISAVALIAFNILATAIFHFPPVGKEYLNFVKNLSITGGLILLLGRFNEK